ncbi:MAG TPA: cytidylate kinase-like family protein [Candidatus Blautia avistercoris]|nr:cytidylate kinase-like family protein [Candidatus Blautia avistercoris]
MRYKYITIEREYGSGGTEIARRVAEGCGIPCYGREILEFVAKEYNIAVEEIDRYEETVTNSLLYTFFVLGRVQSGESDMLAKEGHIFVAEQAAITKLASYGPAIFVGHCASEALKEKHQVLHVFIKSNTADKKARIMEEYHIPEEKVETAMRRFDKKRSNYYYANTARKWTDNENYDLVLDSGKLGLDGCVAAIKGVFKDK